MNMYQGTTTTSLALAAAMEHIPAEIRDALLKLERLSTLPRRCMVAVAEAARIADYKAGAVIVGRDSQPVVLYLLKGRVIVKHSNGSSMRHDATDEPVARPLYRAGEEVEIIAARSARLLQIPNAVYVRQLSLAASAPEEEDLDDFGADGDEHDGLERALHGGVLSQLPSEQVQQLLLRFEERPLHAGEVVYAEGDPADGYFIVQHGAVELHSEATGGQRTRIAVLGPGDAFGEEALIMGPRRGETATLLTAGTLLRVASVDFETLLRPALVRTVLPAEASALVKAGACWLDVRESRTHAIELSRFAIKMPLSTLRAKRGTLSTDRAYIVYADDPQREALACFLLAASGVSCFTLDGHIEQMEAEPGQSTDDVFSDNALGGHGSGDDDLEDDLLGDLDGRPGLELLSDEALNDSIALEALMQGGSVFGFTLAEPDEDEEVELESTPPTDRTVSLKSDWVDLELNGLASLGMDEPASLPGSVGTEVEALLAAERAKYERRLASKVAELRLLARRKAKEVLNRRTAELRARVLARMKELRAEKKRLATRLRAGEAAQAALAAERTALAQERAALEAERASLELERAASARKTARPKRVPTRRRGVEEGQETTEILQGIVEG